MVNVIVLTGVMFVCDAPGLSILIGSFLTLTVSVIFPAACYLKMFEDEMSDKEKAINWVIMLLGGFGVVAAGPHTTSHFSSAP